MKFWERQRKGIAIAKAAEKYKGRQPIPVDLTALQRECKLWCEGKQMAKRTMQKLGMKPNRFYRKVKEYGL